MITFRRFNNMLFARKTPHLHETIPSHILGISIVEPKPIISREFSSTVLSVKLNLII